MPTTEETIAALLIEVKAAREEVAKADAARLAAMEELKAEVAKGSKSSADTEAKLKRIADDQAAAAAKQQSFEEAINGLSKKMNRPGGNGADAEEVDRIAAIELLRHRHNIKVPKIDAQHAFNPSEDQITEGMLAVKAMHNLMKTVDVASLPADERKALSSFALGSSGFILPPEMSSRILSCLVDVSDITGLFDSMTISGPSIKFMVDNVRLMEAAWACETSCFANNPTANLLEGLGELEIKPESLRYVICTNRDLLEDADVDIEAWMLRKINWAFKNTLATAVVSGDGVGKPVGILHPSAGLPIVETGAGTPPGQFTWQDLVLLKYSIPMQFISGGIYLMNQQTFGLTLTMSDAIGRPIMISSPTEDGQFRIAGSPVQIVTQMPDTAPGATPVAFGNWKLVYMIVNRKSVTLQQDPYTVGFCILFKFEARVGGAVICPNAAKLLRIR